METDARRRYLRLIESLIVNKICFPRMVGRIVSGMSSAPYERRTTQGGSLLHGQLRCSRQRTPYEESRLSNELPLKAPIQIYPLYTMRSINTRGIHARLLVIFPAF